MENFDHAVVGSEKTINTIPAPTAKKRTSSIHIIFNDGDIKGGLSSADAKRALEDDDNSGQIKTVIKGYEIDFKVESKPKATLDA